MAPCTPDSPSPDQALQYALQNAANDLSLIHILADTALTDATITQAFHILARAVEQLLNAFVTLHTD